MFTGFNLTTNNDFISYKDSGTRMFNNYQGQVRGELSKFLQPNGYLDGTKMQSDWFPQVTADIFISHSHTDADKAIGLSGWLKEEFGLNVFIDSCIWGYSADLLRMVDNEYCLNDNGRTYDYEKRNYSTSHVHMMLSTALTMMIDKSECIFFLNTPNSIHTNETINKTVSPWIYHELAMTNLIQKRPLTEYRPNGVFIKKALFESASASKPLQVDYDVRLDHLCSIEQVDLANWCREFHNEKSSTPMYIEKAVAHRNFQVAELLEANYPLNTLYEMKGLLNVAQSYSS